MDKGDTIKIPKGYVLVPVECTEYMSDCAYYYTSRFHDKDMRWWRMNMPKDFFKLAHKALISSAHAELLGNPPTILTSKE